MKEKARDLVYLNTKRYLSFADLKTFQRIGLVIGPTLSKILLISGVGAGIRWLIDKLIPEI